MFKYFGTTHYSLQASSKLLSLIFCSSLFRLPHTKIQSKRVHNFLPMHRGWLVSICTAFIIFHDKFFMMIQQVVYFRILSSLCNYLFKIFSYDSNEFLIFTVFKGNLFCAFFSTIEVALFPTERCIKICKQMSHSCLT